MPVSKDSKETVIKNRIITLKRKAKILSDLGKDVGWSQNLTKELDGTWVEIRTLEWVLSLG